MRAAAQKFSVRLSTASAASFVASRQRRMGVADARDVLAAGLELHRHHGLGDQLAGHRADDVHAEDLVGLGVGQELDHAGGVAERARAAVGHEREGAGLVGAACGLELLLGLADPGDLGAGVDDPGNGVEVDVAMLAGDALGHRDALLLGLVRQHRPAHHVADRPDAGQVGAAVVVDDDGAALVELEADGLGVQAVGVGHAADRHDQAVDSQRLCSPPLASV